MFDKVTSRIKKLCYGLDQEFIDPFLISQKVMLFQERRQYTCYIQLIWYMPL